MDGPDRLSFAFVGVCVSDVCVPGSERRGQEKRARHGSMHFVWEAKITVSTL